MREADHEGNRATSVDDILITPQLALRPARAPDHAAENRALVALAQEMASNPRGVLQKCAELAMELCRADSAGISVLEPGGTNGIFRWHATTGAFAANLGGTMPREESPCGTVIARNSVLLFIEAERFFPALRGVRPRIYENLLAPWHANGKAVGTLWAIKHSPECRFDAEDARLLASLAQFASAAHQVTASLAAASAGREELRDSEARLRLIVENARDYAIFTTDPEDRIEAWWPGAEAVFGWTAAEAVGRPGSMLFTPEDRDRHKDVEEFEIARREGVAPNRRWHMRKDSARVFIDGNVTALRDKDGELRGFLKIGQDVTERRRVEEALRESEERLKFLDRLGEATARTSAPREIMATTAALLGRHLRVTRCAYADVDANNDHFTIRDDWTDDAPSSAGEYSLDLFGPRAAADMRAGRTLVVQDVDAELPADDGGGMFSAIGIKAIICCPLVKGGRLVAMMAVHQSFPRGWTKGEVALLETAVERSWAHIERVRDEAALRESEERLRLIVEGARDYAIFTTDSEGRIDAWMPGAANVFGWSPQEAVGCPVAITFTPEDREKGEPEKELEIARREGAAPNVRWHLRKDGARVFIEGSMVALRRLDGGVRGFLKIGQDVTGRRAAEEAQALLAREVDHRAKNALAVVQTMLRLTRADDVPSFARAVEGRVAALARAQTLLAEERWNGAALHAMLRGELAPFLAGQRAELSGPPMVLPPGTAQPLAMAVHELATNAAKHGALSVPEGRVSVSWRLGHGAPGMLRMRWAEMGGPPVAGPPARRGFGSRVLEGTVRGQLGGMVSITWATTGLVCEMEVPLGTS